MHYSISELIDKLSILNMKIFMLIEAIENNIGTSEEIATKAIKVQKLNKERSQVKNAIEEYFKTGRSDVKF